MKKYKVCLYHNCKMISVGVFVSKEKAKEEYEKILNRILKFDDDKGYGYRVSMKEIEEV